jgi:polyribonucleotide nucleotidyltransferase
LPEVIGKGGCYIKAIQDSLSVRLSVPHGVTRDETANVKIGIAGSVEKVIQAKAVIKQITMFYHADITHPGVIHVEMTDVPASTYNLIIGPKGSEIRHIQGNFKVSVHIPNANSNCKELLVVGPPQNVESAAAYIRKIVNQSAKDESAASEAFGWPTDGVEEPVQEVWMEQYVHLSAADREQPLEAPAAAPVSKPLSAWGSAVAYSEGW